MTEYLQAVERKDWKTVRSHISDNISGVSPGPENLISFKKAEPFMSYLEHSNDLRPWDIKKQFVDGNDVCLLSEVTYRNPPVTIFVCVWYQVNDDGKISSIRVVFDPRPFIPDRQ